MKRAVVLILSLFLGGVSYAAFPAIYFNTGTGSDTAASGAGPGDGIHGGTTLSGSVGAYTLVDSTNIIRLTGTPNLSTVASDGSAAIWLSTAPRRWSKITEVNDTDDWVRVQDLFTMSITSVNWAIGGKRATISLSTQAFTDAYEGWSCLLDDSQTSTVGIPVNPTVGTTDGPFTIGASTFAVAQGTWPTITHTLNSGTLIGGTNVFSLRVNRLKFANSNATKTLNAWLSYSANYVVEVDDCIIGDQVNTMRGVMVRVSANPSVTFKNCEFPYNTTGVGNSTSLTSLSFIGGRVHHTTHGGVNGAVTCLSGTIYIDRLQIDNQVNGDGIFISACVLIRLTNSTVNGAVGDALDTSSAETNTTRASIYNNNLTTSGGFGWNMHANTLRSIGYVGFNNFGSGATANASGNSSIAMDGQLNVDPGYVNPSLGDFRSGANVYGAGFPGTPNTNGNGPTTSFIDIGASQHRDVGGRISVGY